MIREEIREALHTRLRKGGLTLREHLQIETGEPVVSAKEGIEKDASKEGAKKGILEPLREPTLREPNVCRESFGMTPRTLPTQEEEP
jgi:hypothetical protein